MGENNPSYYAIIPANVRYDERLKANEKLLYGEITALTQKTGECWASNKYFADLYGVTPQAVSSWILNLQKRGYIMVDYIYKKDSKEIEKRVIKMVSTNIAEVSINVEGGINKCSGGYQQNFKENNTSINNTSNNNINNSMTKTIQDIIEYMNKCGELEDFKIKKVFSYKANASSNIKIISARIKEGYTLDDFKDVIYYAYNTFVENEYTGLNGKGSSQYYNPNTIFTSAKMEKYKSSYDNM